MSELQEEPKNLAVLFNDYAVPFRVWDVCLEIVAAANHNDPTYNRQLWDAYLTQVSPPPPPTRRPPPPPKCSHLGGGKFQLAQPERAFELYSA